MLGIAGKGSHDWGEEERKQIESKYERTERQKDKSDRSCSNKKQKQKEEDDKGNA